MLLHRVGKREGGEGGEEGGGREGRKSISSSFFQVLYPVVMQAYTLVERLGKIIFPLCLPHDRVYFVWPRGDILLST